jgi:SAM-dependent methyltransferase
MKRFDRRYFDRWYRNPRHRVRTRAGILRHAELAVAVAEYVLERRVRRVLDVGCGEGLWRAALRMLRPRATYVGIESSEYVVQRFGARRNIRLGSFGTLGDRDDLEQFDLVVCVDVLHYLTTAEIARGARALGTRLHGVALLHAFARGDDIVGDMRGLVLRRKRWYADTFGRGGLRPIGLGCWVGSPLARALSVLETPVARGGR